MSSVLATSAPLQAPVPAPPPHSGTSVNRYFYMLYPAAIVPLTVGVLLYGWRALAVTIVVVGSTLGMVWIWQRVGSAGRQLRYPQAIWAGILLSLMLPAQLATTRDTPDARFAWPILLVAGGVLAIVLWFFGGLGSNRIHPAVASYLILLILFGPMLVPDRILQRDRAARGDLFNSAPDIALGAGADPWVSRPSSPMNDSIRFSPASQRLADYTRGKPRPDGALVRLGGMLRDQMPPLEDYIVAGQPGPIGAGSAVAVVVGGLLLLYRGLIDFRIPLLSVIAAFVMFLILPIPAHIAEQPAWRWCVSRLSDVGWPTGVTLANYEIFASPLIFAAFFLATFPSIRPMSRRASAVYGILLGILAAGFQLYVSVAVGPYLALLVVGLIGPELDRFFRPRKLV